MALWREEEGQQKENLRLPIRHSVVEMCATPPCPEGVDLKGRWIKLHGNRGVVVMVSVEVEKHIRVSQGRAGDALVPALR